MKDLKGMNCLITGAASGVGRALAAGLADEGMNLFLADIDTDGLARVKSELEGKEVRVLTGRCDVSSYEEFQELAREFAHGMGPLDVLINNAGIAGAGLVEQLDPWEWSRVFDVNIWSVIYSVRSFLPAMIERGSGHIVNVGSGAGIVGIPYHIQYVASKFAVVGLSEALYSELKHVHKGIEVSVICPSFLRTSIIDRTTFNLSGRLVAAEAAGLIEGRTGEFAHRLWESYTEGSPPLEEVVRKYIRGIRKNRLYIFDTPRLRAGMALKGLSETLYRKALRREGEKDLKLIRSTLRDMGIKPGEF